VPVDRHKKAGAKDTSPTNWRWRCACSVRRSRDFVNHNFFQREAVTAPNAWGVTYNALKIDELGLPAEFVDEPFFLVKQVRASTAVSRRCAGVRLQ
jgi:hypothetical protein